MRFLSTTVAAAVIIGQQVAVLAKEEQHAGGGPPPFFLQDPTDSLCLAGEEFKRCSIDTLFYVVGPTR